jgi:hypothetical protein
MTSIRAALAAITIGAALSLPAFAKDRCVFLCGTETDATPASARDLLTVDLGGPLPSDMQVVGYVEGGFQDRFLQVRLHGTRAGAEALLGLLGHTLADAVPGAISMTAVVERDWWDLDGTSPVQLIETHGPHLDYLTIGIRPDPSYPDLVTLYLLGFNA